MKKLAYVILIFAIAFQYILITTAHADDNTKRLKRRVAVFDFEDKTSHHYRWWTGQPVGEGMADMLVTALVETGNYRVFERQEMESLLKEQSLGMAGIVTPESAAQAGKMLGVEIAIIGSVTEFGHAEGGVGGQVKGIGVGIKSTDVTVGLDIRFINTTTGEITLAKSVRKAKSKKGIGFSTPKFSFDSKHKFDESLVGKATRDAVNEVVDLTKESSSKVPWQAKIIRANGVIFINAGNDSGVGVDDEFIVYRPGEELIDPDLGISLGAVETKIGIIKVTNNMIGNGKASQCVVIEGSGFARNDLVREQ